MEEASATNDILRKSTTDKELHSMGPRLKFCTAKERENYKKLKIQMEKGTVTRANLNSIMIGFIKHRAPLTTVVSSAQTFWNFLKSDDVCLCMCLLTNLKNACCGRRKRDR